MAEQHFCGPCANYMCSQYGCQRRRAHSPSPSIAEQMGVDPVSKLAKAIERLCERLEGTRD